MKKYFVASIFFVMSVFSFLQAADDALSLLGKTVGRQRDEMFDFKVTYSDVKVANGSLCFTQNMFHSESMGSFKITIKYSLPLKNLKAAERKVDPAKGIGKNPVLEIKLPADSKAFYMDMKTETRDQKGKIVKRKGMVQAQKGNVNFCTLNFSTSEEAEAWNNKLTEYLDAFGKQSK